MITEFIDPYAKHPRTDGRRFLDLGKTRTIEKQNGKCTVEVKTELYPGIEIYDFDGIEQAKSFAIKEANTPPIHPKYLRV